MEELVNMTAVLAEEAANAHQEDDQGGREQGSDQPGQEVRVSSIGVVSVGGVGTGLGEQASTQERITLKHRGIVGVEEGNRTRQVIEGEVEDAQRRQSRELRRNRP